MYASLFVFVRGIGKRGTRGVSLNSCDISELRLFIRVL